MNVNVCLLTKRQRDRSMSYEPKLVTEQRVSCVVARAVAVIGTIWPNVPEVDYICMALTRLLCW